MQQMTEAGLLGSQNGFRYVLSRPAFRLVWFAQVASQTADKFVMFSLIILAYKVTGASTNVAITLLAYTLPALFIPPFAGVFADRHNRKNIMVWANVGRGAAVALIPIVALWPPIRGDVLHLLLITFLFSSLGQLFSPAEAAAIPSLLPKRALLTANSMVMITMVLTLLVGGALAPLAARIDAYLPYWIASGFFVLSALLILFSDIPRNQPAREQTSRNAARQLITELYEALAFLRASAVLMSSFAQLSLAVLVLFMMFTLAPAYVSTVVGIQAQDSYVILLPATIGAMLSALALGQFGRHAKRSRLLVGSLVATGLTLIALASVPFAMRHVPGLADYTRDFAAVFAFVLGVEFGFGPMDAYQLLTQVSETPVANVVDPNYTFVSKIRKAYLPGGATAVYGGTHARMKEMAAAYRAARA